MHYFPHKRSGILVPHEFSDDRQSIEGNCAQECMNHQHSPLKIALIVAIIGILAAISAPITAYFLSPQATTPAQISEPAPPVSQPSDDKNVIIIRIEISDSFEKNKLESEAFNQDLNGLIKRHLNQSVAPKIHPDTLSKPHNPHDLISFLDISALRIQGMTLVDLVMSSDGLSGDGMVFAIPSDRLGSTEALFSYSPYNLNKADTVETILSITTVSGDIGRIILGHREGGRSNLGIDSCAPRGGYVDIDDNCTTSRINSSKLVEFYTDSTTLMQILERLETVSTSSDTARISNGLNLIGKRNLSDLVIYRHDNNLYATKRGDLIAAVTINTLRKYLPVFLLSLLITLFVSSFFRKIRRPIYYLVA